MPPQRWILQYTPKYEDSRYTFGIWHTQSYQSIWRDSYNCKRKMLRVLESERLRCEMYTWRLVEAESDVED